MNFFKFFIYNPVINIYLSHEKFKRENYKKNLVKQQQQHALLMIFPALNKNKRKLYLLDIHSYQHRHHRIV